MARRCARAACEAGSASRQAWQAGGLQSVAALQAQVIEGCEGPLSSAESQQSRVGPQSGLAGGTANRATL